MSPQDKESELSYAYFHAVASSVGAACQQTTRTRDNLGIDATLSLIHDFGARAVFTDLGLNQRAAEGDDEADRDDSVRHRLPARHRRVRPPRLRGLGWGFRRGAGYSEARGA